MMDMGGRLRKAGDLVHRGGTLPTMIVCSKNYFLALIFSSLVIFLSSCSINRHSPTSSDSKIDSLSTETMTVTLTNNVTTLTPETPHSSIETKWHIIPPRASANQIRVMLFDQSGGLWIGGPGGLVHWDMKTNQPTVYAYRDSTEETNITALAQSKDGVLWVGTYGKGLFRFDGAKWTSYTTLNGMPGDYITSLNIGSGGELYVNSYETKDLSSYSAYFGSFDGHNWNIIPTGGFREILAGPDGLVWGISELMGYFHVSSYDGSQWRQWELKHQKPTALTVDDKGSVWVATGTSLLKNASGTWDEISSDVPWNETHLSVTSIAVTNDGEVWVGLSFLVPDSLDPCGERWHNAPEMGIYRYDGKSWSQFTANDGLIDNKICAVLIAPDNTVWFGSFDEGISHFDGRNWYSYVIR